MERMKQQPVFRQQWFEFTGWLSEKIGVVNNARLNHQISNFSIEEKTLPVTSNQLQRIIVEAVSPAHNEYAWNGDENNAWSIVNFGTEQLKPLYPGNNNLTLFAAHANWTKLVEQKFMQN